DASVKKKRKPTRDPGGFAFLWGQDSDLAWRLAGLECYPTRQDWNPISRGARHGIPRYFCVCRLSRQRGWARQYSTAKRVLRSRSDPSIGCKKKWRKLKCS